MKATGLLRKRRGMTPIHVHREKKRENHTQKEKRRRREVKTPHSEEDKGVSTEMQQDQIRAYGLFILVNTTPRIYLKF